MLSCNFQNFCSKYVFLLYSHHHTHTHLHMHTAQHLFRSVKIFQCDVLLSLSHLPTQLNKYLMNGI